ncbi:MAG: sulfite oxidase [SAR202 cluster bacterium]|nr:sulfite oxidase [SAR202 cluster bacterium]
MLNKPAASQRSLRPVSADPQCEEAILTSLDSLITPAERFYIRSHFSQVPRLDGRTWKLTVGGEVRRPLTLSLADLKTMPAVEQAATLECAGNSRSYVKPPVEGLAFLHGAVSTGWWKGVPLAQVLAQAGLKDTAKEVVFQGADHGREEEHGEAVELSYERSLPVGKAMQPDTLLAYQMNGEDLTPEHGYPVRLVTPGWYAMASVKWLTSIRVDSQPFDGFFQGRRYVMINEGPEHRIQREPVTLLRVKSLFTSPRHGEVVQLGRFNLHGVAWSGAGPVVKVEVSFNGGRHWRQARLVGEDHPNAWRRWELDWRVAEPGHFILMVRATDAAGNTQPKNIPWNFRGYANNAIHAIAVEVPG